MFHKWMEQQKFQVLLPISEESVDCLREGLPEGDFSQQFKAPVQINCMNSKGQSSQISGCFLESVRSQRLGKSSSWDPSFLPVESMRGELGML